MAVGGRRFQSWCCFGTVRHKCDLLLPENLYMRLPVIAFLLAGFLPLMGCQTLGLTSGAPQIVLDPGPVCPATAVLSDAATVAKLKPGVSTAMAKATDISFQAEMSQARLDCNYNRADNKLVINVKFAVKASRGPAAAATNPQLPYFISIIDADNNVLVKNVYNSQPQMEGRSNNTYTETVSDLPVPLAMDRRPSDYEILTGFQLTPDELAYNRIPRTIPAPRAAAR
jgi:hypothetical protein